LDDLGVILRGFAIGLAVAIPVGPIALLCMRRTLERGFRFGFSTGLGAAVADLIFAAVAAFGIAAVEALLLDYQLALALGGGIFLLVLAGKTAIARPAATIPKFNANGGSAASALVSGFVITATNPLTLLGFVAIFAGFGVGNGLTNDRLALALVLGVFLGSTVWWLALTTVITRIRHLFSPVTIHRLNLAAAALLAAFGVYELIRALMMAAPWLF